MLGKDFFNGTGLFTNEDFYRSKNQKRVTEIAVTP
jgi:hypothetical protein